jgi:hypothetical protein
MQIHDSPSSPYVFACKIKQFAAPYLSITGRPRRTRQVPLALPHNPGPSGI